MQVRSRIIDVPRYERVGRKFIDPAFRGAKAFASAQELFEKGRQLADSNPAAALVLLREANSRCFELCREIYISEGHSNEDGQLHRLMKDIKGVQAAIYHEHFKEIDFDHFTYNRFLAFESARNVDETSETSCHRIRALYADLVSSYPKICHEKLLADLQFMGLFEGSGFANELSNALFPAIVPESYITDADLAREINLSVPITLENLGLLFYASGLWLDANDGNPGTGHLCYQKASRLLFAWAITRAMMIDANINPTDVQDISRRLVIPGPIVQIPRGLTFIAQVTSSGDGFGCAEFRQEFSRFVIGLVMQLGLVKGLIKNPDFDNMLSADFVHYAIGLTVSPMIDSLCSFFELELMEWLEIV